MRKHFFEILNIEAKKNKDLIFLTADLGFGFVEDFSQKYPKQFINTGVAEQAMLGLANGLALSGKKVICYSIAAFSLIRPFEFFRNGAIAQNHPVMVVGVGPGFDYSHDGLSHYCLEDLALVQSQPGISIKMPFNDEAVRINFLDFLNNPRPTYMRLPRNSIEFNCKDLSNDLVEEKDVIIICTALMGKRATLISSKLDSLGISNKITSINELSLNMDKKIIQHLVFSKKCVVIEDHYEFGGLGSRIGDLILQNKLNTQLVKDGVVATPKGAIGSFEFIENKIMKNITEVILRITNCNDI